jgi:transcriptional regulator with XRE-family HTH domain
MLAPPLGERLRYLRTTLAMEAFDPKDWSRARVASAADVSNAALARLENTGRSTAVTLAALLHFYQDQGFNLAWVLTPDNAQIPTRLFRDLFQEERTAEATEILLELRRLVQPPATALPTGPEPSPAELPPLLLAQIRAGIHCTLVHLLPRIALIRTEVDFRHFQRRMPPVAATAAGWQSTAAHLVPYHYYEAGSSLPRCGIPLYYLQFDQAPTDPSNSIKCLTCAYESGESWAPDFRETFQPNRLLRRA